MKAHPDIKGVVFEPFNTKRIKDKPIKSMEQLRSELAESKKAECFKVMRYNILPCVAREWVLSDDLPVISLYRKNFLKGAVSGFLANSVKAWHKPQLPGNYAIRRYSSMSIKGIKNNMTWKDKSDQRFREILRDVKQHMEVCYEDFYFKDGWKRLLPKIYQHVGHKPFMNDKINWLMKSQRVNNERVYLNIKNIYEIERECGSDKHGWLFNNCPLML